MKARKISVNRARRALARDQLAIGGDFLQWSKRVDTILRAQDLFEYSYQSATSASKSSVQNMLSQPTHTRKARASTAIHLLCVAVGPLLWPRVAKLLLQDPSAFWNYLERLSRPFRLLNLCPELRNALYTTHLSAEHDKPLIGKYRPKTYEVPALLHASSQVRREARSLYFFRCPFYLLGNLGPTSEYGVTRTAKTWVSNVVNDQAKHIRKITVVVRTCCRHQYIQFLIIIGKDNKFVIRSPGALGPNFREKLDYFVSEIETMRRSRGWEGEAIIHALIGESPAWKPWERQNGECMWR